MTTIDISDVQAIEALAAACRVSVNRVRSAVDLAGPDENDIRNHLQKVIFLNTNIAEEKTRTLQGR